MGNYANNHRRKKWQGENGADKNLLRLHYIMAFALGNQVPRQLMLGPLLSRYLYAYFFDMISCKSNCNYESKIYLFLLRDFFAEKFHPRIACRYISVCHLPRTGYFYPIWICKHISSNKISRNYPPLRRVKVLRKSLLRTIDKFLVCDSSGLRIFFFAFQGILSCLFGWQLVFLSILLFWECDFCNELTEELSFFHNQCGHIHGRDLAYLPKKKNPLQTKALLSMQHP